MGLQAYPGEGSICLHTLFEILLQRCVSLSYLFIQVIHLCQYRLVYKYILHLSYNPVLLLYFLVWFFQCWPLGFLFSDCSQSFQHSAISFFLCFSSFFHFFLFPSNILFYFLVMPDEYCIVICIFFSPNTKNSPFSKMTWFLSLENGVQKPRSSCWVFKLLLEWHCF